MKLTAVKLTNFRGYEQETTISFEDLTVLIGRNDAGKSTILDALDVFFNGAAIEKDDCCVRTNNSEVRISCVFDSLPEAIVIDANNSTTLNDEHLLREDGQLEIAQIFQCSSGKGKQKAVLARAFHPTAENYNDLLTLKITALKARARELGVALDEVNQGVSAELRRAIWSHADDLACVELDLDLLSETGKEVWKQIQACLPVYALFKSDRTSTDQDAEAKDPMMAAVKEAVQRRMGDLEGVLGEIQDEVQRVANRTVEKIKEMNPDLASQLNPQIKNKNWDSLFSVSLTGDEQIPINKRGSGTRRLVLLNFFRAKAEDQSASKSAGVIYAVEEPETSQHPDHQIMLLKAFEELVEQGHCQVIVTTHTPTLARRVDCKCLRFVQSINGVPTVKNGDEVGTLNEIKATLGVLPDHDIKVFVGVEGPNDIEFFTRISKILSQAEPDIPNLAEAVETGQLMFIPLGGSNMDLWIQRLQGLDRPEFYITDRDNAPPAEPKYKAELDQWNARANVKGWATTKRELENYIHPNAIRVIAATYSSDATDHFEDVPELVAQALCAASPSARPWNEQSDAERKRKCSKAKRRLNREAVDAMTPELLTVSDPHDEIRSWLRLIKLSIEGLSAAETPEMQLAK